MRKRLNVGENKSALLALNFQGYEAKRYSGHSCKNDGTTYANGRCKYHGDASTGSVTPEGKKRISMNNYPHINHKVTQRYLPPPNQIGCI
jgi:hypothetical protein